jgi:transcriptional regulator with XRE-family HTH domain
VLRDTVSSVGESEVVVEDLLHSGSGPEALGQRLREAREAQKIGVREIAKRVSVSASLISQIERGKVMPSVGTLYAVVKELDISMDELFASDEAKNAAVGSKDDGPVQRADTRKTIYLASGVRWERLTTGPDPDLEFQLSTYEPGSESCPADNLMTHDGHEYGFVLRGRLQVTIGNDSYDLSTGESLSFSSTEPHRLANVSDETAEALWVVLGRERDKRLASS